MPTSLLPIDTCDKCKFFWKPAEHATLCRRHPPGVTNIPVAADPNNNPITVATSSFSPIQPDWWCGEFKRKILDA